MIQTKESILERCEEILRYKSDVLLAHEIETVNLVSTQLSMSLNIESSSGVAEFPPARSSEMKLSMGKTFHANSNQELVSNPDTYVSFLYYVLVDVEISAMEICAHMILSNKSMPIEFTLDITKQIWDEARHAQFIYELFLKTGGRIRDHSYTNTVIDRYLHSETLLEALIIQQILQEGNAVEVNLSLIEELLSLKRLSEANAFYNINNDEAYHVTIGNKWINYLVMADEIQEEELLQIMLAAADKIDIPLFGKGGWNSEIRELVGFPSWFIEVRDRIFSS